MTAGLVRCSVDEEAARRRAQGRIASKPLAGAFSTDWLETRSGTAMNAAPLRDVTRITHYGSWNRQSVGTFDLKPFKKA